MVVCGLEKNSEIHHHYEVCSQALAAIANVQHTNTHKRPRSRAPLEPLFVRLLSMPKPFSQALIAMSRLPLGKQRRMPLCLPGANVRRVVVEQGGGRNGAKQSAGTAAHIKTVHRNINITLGA
jgi:hypothetical protein